MRHPGAVIVKRPTKQIFFWLITASLSAPLASASVINVDNFGIGSIALEATNTSRVASLELQATPSAIGGFRSTEVELLSEYLSVQANINPIPNILAFSSTSQSTGQLELIYLGAENAGLGGIDLTDGGTNQVINVDFTSADSNAEIRIGLWETNGDYAETLQTLSGGPETLSFQLSDFTVDATSIDGINVKLLGQENGDYTINRIYATVPEPSTFTIGTLFVIAVIIGFRRSLHDSCSRIGLS